VADARGRHCGARAGVVYCGSEVDRMPTAALPYCVEPGCTARVPSGRCAAHRQDVEAYRPNIHIRRLYRTARWRRIREQKQRENPLCAECQANGYVEPWTDLDHRIPHRGDLVLFWDASNLVGLCHPHHSAKTRRGE
jgi:5-methylcytosine-specific restriction enzyme A